MTEPASSTEVTAEGNGDESTDHLAPPRPPSSDALVGALVAGIDHIEGIQHQHAIQGISAIAVAVVATYQLAISGDGGPQTPSVVLVLAVAVTCVVYVCSAKSTSIRLRELRRELKDLPTMTAADYLVDLATRLRPVARKAPKRGSDDAKPTRVATTLEAARAWLAVLSQGRVWGFLLVATIVTVAVDVSFCGVATAKAKASAERHANKEKHWKAMLEGLEKRQVPAGAIPQAPGSRTMQP